MKKKQIRIQQHILSVHEDGHTQQHMVIIEIKGNLPVNTYVVEMPKSFNFWDEKFHFYPINQN